MSDYTASSLETQVQDIARFIESEGEASRKGVRNSLIFAGLFSVILIFYFFVLLTPWVERTTAPDRLSADIAAVAKHNVAGVTNMMGKVLAESAKPLADFIADTVVREGVPYVVGRSEEYLVSYIDELATMSQEQLGKAFDEVLQESRSEFEAAIDAPDADQASKLFEPVSDNMHKMLDRTRGEGEAQQSIDKAQVALSNMNRRLKALISKDNDDKSRKEHLAQRTLTMWWAWVKRPSLDDKESKPIPLGAGNMPSKPSKGAPAPPAE